MSIVPSDDGLVLALANAANATYSGAAPTWENDLKTCHCFQSVVGDINCFAFKGTANDQTWLEDFYPIEVPDPSFPDIGPVHQPTLDHARWIVPLIAAKLDSLGKPPCYVVGHSAGGRDAPLVHAMLRHLGYTVLMGAYFEPPPVAGMKLRTYLADQNIVATRTWNAHGSDIVTLVPDGPGWVNVQDFLRLQVPDSFGISAKHVMSGVIVGLQALP